MNNQENKVAKKRSINMKTKLADEVKIDLPKMHMKYLKKFRGIHNFINKFIYVPDVINGGDSDNLSDRLRDTCEVGQFLSSATMKYELVQVCFDKLMRLKFRYLFQDTGSGLCSIAWLIETSDGWEVEKIEAFV
jgi:hypothetical protein